MSWTAVRMFALLEAAQNTAGREREGYLARARLHAGWLIGAHA